MKLATTESGITIIELDPTKKVIMFVDAGSGISGEHIKLEDGIVLFKGVNDKITFVECEELPEVVVK